MLPHTIQSNLNRLWYKHEILELVKFKQLADDIIIFAIIQNYTYKRMLKVFCIKFSVKWKTSLHFPNIKRNKQLLMKLGER